MQCAPAPHVVASKRVRFDVSANVVHTFEAAAELEFDDDDAAPCVRGVGGFTETRSQKRLRCGAGRAPSTASLGAKSHRPPAGGIVRTAARPTCFAPPACSLAEEPGLRLAGCTPGGVWTPAICR